MAEKGGNSLWSDQSSVDMNYMNQSYPIILGKKKNWGNSLWFSPGPGMFDAVGLRQKCHGTRQLNDALLAVATAALFADGLFKPGMV